jgi:hypothetical protein
MMPMRYLMSIAAIVPAAAHTVKARTLPFDSYLRLP